MYSKTAIRELSARYRLILRKCFLLNLGLVLVSTSALADQFVTPNHENFTNRPDLDYGYHIFPGENDLSYPNIAGTEIYLEVPVYVNGVDLVNNGQWRDGFDHSDDESLIANNSKIYFNLEESTTTHALKITGGTIKATGGDSWEPDEDEIEAGVNAAGILMTSGTVTLENADLINDSSNPFIISGGTISMESSGMNFSSIGSEGSKINENSDDYTGDGVFHVSGGSISVISGEENYLVGGDVKFSDGSLNISEGAKLQTIISPSNETSTTIKLQDSGEINLSGTLVANVSGVEDENSGTLTITNRNALVDGNIQGVNVSLNENIIFDGNVKFQTDKKSFQTAGKEFKNNTLLLNDNILTIQSESFTNNIHKGSVVINDNVTMNQSELQINDLTINENKSLSFSSDYKGVFNAFQSTQHSIGNLEIQKGASATFKNTTSEFTNISLIDSDSNDNRSNLTLNYSSFDGTDESTIWVGKNATLNLTDSELYGSSLNLAQGSRLNYSCLNCEDDTLEKEYSVADFSMEFDNITADGANIVLGDKNRENTPSLQDQAILAFKEKLDVKNSSNLTLNGNTQLFYSGFEGKGNIAITNSSLTLNDNSLFLIGEEDSDASGENPYNAPATISGSTITLNDNSQIEVYTQNNADFSLSNSRLILNDESHIDMGTLSVKENSSFKLSEQSSASIETLNVFDGSVALSTDNYEINNLHIKSKSAKVIGPLTNVDIYIDVAATLESVITHEIDSTNNLTISENGNLNITKNLEIAQFASTGGLNINGAEVVVRDDAFISGGTIQLNNGADIETDTDFNITGGNFTLKNESKLEASKNMNINGGTFNLNNSYILAEDARVDDFYGEDTPVDDFDDPHVAGNFNMTNGEITMKYGSIIGATGVEKPNDSDQFYGGPVHISGGQISVKNGKNYLIGNDIQMSGGEIFIDEYATLEVGAGFDGSVFPIETDKTREIATINLKNSGTINLEGALIGDIKGPIKSFGEPLEGTLNINHSNATIDGIIEYVNISINADANFDKIFRKMETDEYNARLFYFNNMLMVNDGVTLNITVPDNFKYDYDFGWDEEDEDENNRKISLRELAVNGSLNVKSTTLFAYNGTFNDNASVNLNLSDIETNNMTINGGTYTLKNDSSLDARSVQTIHNGSFTLNESEMGGDEGIVIHNGLFNLSNDSEIATNGIEKAPDVNIKGGTFTFNSSHILSRTEYDEKGSITIEGGDITFNKSLIGAYNYSDHEYRSQEGGEIDISGGSITFKGGNDIHAEAYWNEKSGILSNIILAENITLSGDAMMHITKGATLKTISNLYMEDDDLDFYQDPASLIIDDNATLKLEGNLRAKLDILGGTVVAEKTSSVISGLNPDNEHIIRLEDGATLNVNKGVTLTLGHVEKEPFSKKNPIAYDTLSINGGTLNLLGTLNANVTGTEITVSGVSGKINGSLNVDNLTLHNRTGKLSSAINKVEDVENLTLSGELNTKGKASTTYTLDKSVFIAEANPRYWIKWKYIDDNDPYEGDNGFNFEEDDKEESDYKKVISITKYDNQITGDLTIQTANFSTTKDLAVGNLIVTDNASATIKSRFVTGTEDTENQWVTPGDISVLNNSTLTLSTLKNWEDYVAVKNLTIQNESKFVADKLGDIGISNLSASDSTLEIKNKSYFSASNLSTQYTDLIANKSWVEATEADFEFGSIKGISSDIAFGTLTTDQTDISLNKKTNLSANDMTISGGNITVETGACLGALNKENIMIDEGYIFGYELNPNYAINPSDVSVSDSTITLNGTGSLQNAISITKITESGPDEIIGVLDENIINNPNVLIDKYIKQARKSGVFEYESEREYRDYVHTLIESQRLVKGNITLTDSTIQMNGTSSVNNLLFNDLDESGYITVIGGDIIANGKNTISASNAVTFDGTNIEVLAGKTLNINSYRDGKNISDINDVRLKLAGTLNANLKGSVSTLVLGKKGKYTGDWNSIDFSNLTNFGISGITSTKDLGSALSTYANISENDIEQFEITDKSKLVWDTSTKRLLSFNNLLVDTGSTLDVKRDLNISGDLSMDNAKLTLAKDTSINANNISLTNTNVNIAGSTYYSRAYSTKLQANEIMINNSDSKAKTNLKNVSLLSTNENMDFSATILGGATLTNVDVKGDLWLGDKLSYDKKGKLIYKSPTTLTNVSTKSQSNPSAGTLHVEEQKVILKAGNTFTGGISIYNDGIVDVTQNVQAGLNTNIDGGTLNVNTGKELGTSTLVFDNWGTLNLKGTLDAYNISGEGILNIQNAKAKVYGDISDITLGFEKVKTNISNNIYGDFDNLISLDLKSSTLTIDREMPVIDYLDTEKSTLNLTQDLTVQNNVNAESSTFNLGTNKLIADEIHLSGKSNINLTVKDKNTHGQLIANDILVLGYGEKSDKIALNITIDKSVTKSELDGAKFNFLEYPEEYIYGNLNSVKINNNRYKFTETAVGQFEVEETLNGKGVIKRYSGESKNAMAAASALVDNNQTFTLNKQQKLSENLNTLSQQTGAEQDYLDSLDATNPDTNGMVQENEMANINLGMDAASSRLSTGGLSSTTIGRSAGDGGSAQGSMWTKVLYNKSKMDSSHQYRGFKGYTQGLAIGVDKYLSENVKAGIAYAYTDGDIKNNIRKTTVDSHSALLYGEYKPTNWFVNGIASYGWSNYDSKSTSVIGATTSDFDAHSTAIKLNSGYDVVMNNTTVTPIIGIQYTNIKRNAYNDSDEKRISANSSDILTLSAMTKLKSEYHSSEKLSFIPEVRFGITYDVKNDSQSSIINLSNGTSYTVDERALDRLGTEFGIGISAQYDNRYELSAGYEIRAREDYKDHTAIIEAKYHF